MSLHQISLDALLSRNLSVQWFEGVALVQAVCRQVAAARSGFPLQSQIVLSKDGSVKILGSSGTGGEVEAAARLLSDLRSEDAPVQLRLLLSQAVAADNAYPTLEQFSSALAYFERSAPHAILQELFARAAAAPERPQIAGQSKPAPVEAENEKKQEERDPKKKASQKRSQPLVAAAVIVAVVGGAGWILAVGPGRAHLAAAGTSVMKRLGLGTPGTEADAASTSSEPLEKGTGKEASSASAKSSAQSPAHSEQRAKGRTPMRAPEQRALTVASTLSLLPFGSPSAQLLPSEVDGVVTYVISASPVSPTEAGDFVADAAHLYSSTDAQVVPPRHVYPTFPEPPADAEFRNRTVVDVVVSGDGQVESVRLRARPRDVHEFMLLSAAKAWRFEPARLDGRPVRFLHSLTIVRQ